MGEITKQNGTETNATNNLECFDPLPISDTRFVLIVLLGTPAAWFGAISNVFVFVYIVRSCLKKTNDSARYYLAVLAVFDILICVCYLMIMTVDALAIRFMNEPLWVAWHKYVTTMFAVSRMCRWCSTYMIVLASFDRLIQLSPTLHKTRLDRLTGRRQRCATIGVVLLCAGAASMITFWEIQIVENEQCHHVPLSWLLVTNPMAMSDDAVTYFVWDYHVKPILQVYTPFVVLIVTNIWTVTIMRRTHHKSELQRRSTERSVRSALSSKRSKSPLTLLNMTPIGAGENLLELRISHARARRREKHRIRNATVTLLFIVCSYLVCSLLNVSIRILERIPTQVNRILYEVDGEPTAFYTISSDLISLFVVFNSLMRPAIYYYVRQTFKEKPDITLTASNFVTDTPTEAVRQHQPLQRSATAVQHLTPDWTSSHSERRVKSSGTARGLVVTENGSVKSCDDKSVSSAPINNHKLGVML